eukprot:scaffold297_cov171-Amphora_coffeaeformis.AAC.14
MEEDTPRADSNIIKKNDDQETSDNNNNNSNNVTPKRRALRFGSVRVAWHRMTLGNNPGGTTAGPPVTLDWEKEGSHRYETVDGYSQEFHHQHPTTTTTNQGSSTTKRPVYRMSRQQRQDIALQRHTESEIAQIEQEINTIRQARFQSSLEPVDGSIKELIIQQQKKKKGSKKGNQTPKKKTSSPFSSCLGR